MRGRLGDAATPSMAISQSSYEEFAFSITSTLHFDGLSDDTISKHTEILPNLRISKLAPSFSSSSSWSAERIECFWCCNSASRGCGPFPHKKGRRLIQKLSISCASDSPKLEEKGVEEQASELAPLKPLLSKKAEAVVDQCKERSVFLIFSFPIELGPIGLPQLALHKGWEETFQEVKDSVLSLIALLGVSLLALGFLFRESVAVVLAETIPDDSSNVAWVVSGLGTNVFSAPVSSNRRCFVGDDIVIGDPEVARVYRDVMNRLGVQISLAKTLTFGGLEFAKKFRIHDRDSFVVENDSVHSMPVLKSIGCSSLQARFGGQLAWWNHTTTVSYLMMLSVRDDFERKLTEEGDFYVERVMLRVESLVRYVRCSDLIRQRRCPLPGQRCAIECGRCAISSLVKGLVGVGLTDRRVPLRVVSLCKYRKELVVGAAEETFIH
ncbi:RNA-dependent RNA polymerase-like protein [Striga asiatica]|uniref:RNA-dependent RNA polymerase-like protein n=1 Tax=Striga asiatica TaxID=4170 RepID=A0A5A7QS56_STRAF|nr:RNA-dependent RNA polymerase-like protein [Striga asiatica]